MGSNDDEYDYTFQCGVVAAIVSCLFHGSYTVPLKGRRANSVDPHPFVFQTYKVVMNFLLCWFVLFTGDPLSITLYGLISGLLWNVSGTCTVYAVRNAGIVSSVSLSACMSVVVSFVWGRYVFEETFESTYETYLALGLMVLGIIGMSYFSTPRVGGEEVGKLSDELEDDLTDGDDGGLSVVLLDNKSHASQGDYVNGSQNNSGSNILFAVVDDFFPIPSLSEQEMENMRQSRQGQQKSQQQQQQQQQLLLQRQEPDALSISLPETTIGVSRRTMGLCAAVLSGILNGSTLVPMHYASDEDRDLAYTISFGIGSLLVNISIWSLLYLYQLFQTLSFRSALHSIPSLHLRILWLPGLLAGGMWSISNTATILAVAALGQGIGVSAAQAQLVVSGLWGIFYYREVKSEGSVYAWFLFAMITISGVFVLFRDYEEDDDIDGT